MRYLENNSMALRMVGKRWGGEERLIPAVLAWTSKCLERDTGGDHSLAVVLE